jgi:glycosyltransferase involved in cell wall biosynthesis
MLQDEGAAVNAPSVSVIMSVYNGARFLHQAIESILSQTFDDFEFIIVNDGSTDETPVILGSYTAPRMVIIENDSNIGLARSLNKALAIAQGKYIARQDADDFSMPERLARQVTYLDTHPEVGLLGTGSIWVTEDSQDSEVRQSFTENAELQQALLADNRFDHSSVMFRRICVEDTGGWYREDFRYTQDYELWLRLSEAWDIANLPEVLYCHRVHDNMVSISHLEEQEKYAALAKSLAIERRLRQGWNWVFGPRARTPRWMQISERRHIAQRYLWWSSGVRGPGHFMHALQFLLIALYALPTHEPAWRYVAGVVRRKILRLSGI